ncbi:hypothetical protein MLD38_008899 [Melastoma candidum]|uniref:Uncharacterized protein n=1 Tax=Melastoma candidum TaxID=119954 RepID=A0ACB9RWD1_9MYRT|nr:hypothetical protein MLD38_008899 [Melastoma candidum]
MAILSKLTPNLFPPPNPSNSKDTRTPSPTNYPPPIPIPRYPPPPPKPKPTTSPSPPAFKVPHRNTRYRKPVDPGVISSDPKSRRSILIGTSGLTYHLPGAPFDFQFSYSESPGVAPLAIREPAFLPFAPPSMPRPWTGKAPLKGKDGKKVRLFDSFDPPPPGKKGVKYVESPGPFWAGKYPVDGRTREEILGEPLKRWEVRMLVGPHVSDNRQVNLGRDGMTHNMLELIHSHWKRRRVCKVRCRGVPTVDMDNISRVLEEKTGGKIIHRVGGILYLFRGRNYNYRTRPQYPLMLWKPAAPVYPKLIQKSPGGLTEDEANELKSKAKNLAPICKLGKNGIYLNLVTDVRNAFEGSPLVKINCTGMHASDYKKLGAKLRDLVPCVLLSFDDEQILMWRGHDWKSIYPNSPTESVTSQGESNEMQSQGESKEVISSPKMISLWRRAINSNKALLLDEPNVSPDDLLKIVEEFDGATRAAEHSFPAIISSKESEPDDAATSFEGGWQSNSPLGSLPIDRLAKKLLG